jgi:hypothetical protein
MALATSGCGVVESGAPACVAAIPAQSELLRAPGFESLTFHKRTSYNARTQRAGSDLWADAKFEYKAAVEFSLVPSKSGDLCTDAVSIKLLVPPDEPRRRLLRDFVGRVASRSAMKRAEVLARIEARLENKARYGQVAAGNGLSIRAGLLAHPTWGDLFVVSFTAP